MNNNEDDELEEEDLSEEEPAKLQAKRFKLEKGEERAFGISPSVRIVVVPSV
jgi:hypothetical protein